MKKYSILLFSILVLLFSCTSPQIKDSNSKKDEIDVQFETKHIVSGPKEYLTIIDNRTQKKWSISYEDWEKLYLTRQYWNAVASNKPLITDVKEKDGYLEISLAYMYEDPKTKKKEKILGAKIYIPKKYISKEEQKKCELYRSISIGTGVYSIGITILTIVLLIIVL